MILKISGLYVENVRFYGNLNVRKKVTFLALFPETKFFSNKIEIPVENFLLKVFA